MYVCMYVCIDLLASVTDSWERQSDVSLFAVNNLCTSNGRLPYRLFHPNFVHACSASTALRGFDSERIEADRIQRIDREWSDGD